ncbi:MAG: 5'/3'-nucleotidase SurE [Deltaproteobacteria bacterium]|jgi:5'-nucleotidase|nr:5'/3'-nucleotidase SurE [Deltaproteobacteria bacterium]
MFIMLTNDDGIHAAGLRALYRHLRQAGHEVRVIAPLTEQSAVGHAITVLNPLRVKEIEEPGFSGLAVSGTPTDCVKLGITELLSGRRPDLLISGMNAGANVGPDVLYSGTVSAATEGAAMGLPSLAVSHNSRNHVDLESYAEFAVSMAGRIPWAELPTRRVMNLNLPGCAFSACKGLCLCPQTDVPWSDWYEERLDLRGNRYWWLTGDIPMDKVKTGTDKYQLEQGWATLTPLKFDFTDQACLNELAGAFPEALHSKSED